MLKTVYNDDMLQDNGQRVRSQSDPRPPQILQKSDGAIPKIPDHVLEAAQKSKDENGLVGVILR